MGITRREFSTRSLAATAVLAAPMVASPRVVGAIDDILVGIVGLGGRDTQAHVPSFQKQDGVTESGAVCQDILHFSARVVDGIVGRIWGYRHKRLTCSPPEP